MVENESKTKTCFVICPIGANGSDIRKRSDQILKHIITPATKECGYEEPVRADQMSEPGNITSQVIQRIIDSDLVIADLTGHNPNVFYELAVRHAIRKPIIMIMEVEGVVPFDVAQDRVIYLDLKELDSVEDCKKGIIKQIRAIEGDTNQIYSPISIAIDIKLMSEGGNSQQKWFANIVEMLESINAEQRNLFHKFASSAQAAIFKFECINDEQSNRINELVVQLQNTSMTLDKISDKLAKNELIEVEEQDPLKAAWSNILKKIKVKCPPTLHAVLKEAYVISIDESAVTLDFDAKFKWHKEQLMDPSNLKLLETNLSEAMGKPMKFLIPK